MLKKFLLISCLLFLSNCAAPGVALLSPVITGVKTKSVHQASVSLASSLGSNKFIQNHGEKIKIEIMDKSQQIFEYLKYLHKKNV